MATQSEVSRNPRPSSSGKSASFSTTSRPRRHLALAAEVARRLGIVPTWPNVQTIRLAIESEAAYSDTSIKAAAEVLVIAAQFDLSQFKTVNRFWFEDARWRYAIAIKSKAEQRRDDNLRGAAVAKERLRLRLQREANIGVEGAWWRILRVLKTKVDPHSYDTWLQPTLHDYESDGVLFVRVPTVDFLYIKEKFADQIQQAVRQLGLEFSEIRFTSLESPAC